MHDVVVPSSVPEEYMVNLMILPWKLIAFFQGTWGDGATSDDAEMEGRQLNRGSSQCLSSHESSKWIVLGCMICE